ncbi:MAG: ABC transporter ATP-binding protein/permease [Desmonostoc geniculatum HA4340-LM1]|jgi:ATP-binding cassette subfamily B protein|nr:ABC transporter ATP-binding protein/permease [Desmonostoc geniculatum HA4340-LM1]
MVENIFDLAGERKPLFIRGTVFHVIASMFAAAPYFFVYLVLKELFENSINLQKTLALIAAIAICILLQGLFLYLGSTLTFVNGCLMIGDLRLDLGNHIRKLPMGFFTSKQVGDLNVLMTEDLCKIEDIPSVVYPKMVSGILTPAFIGIFLFIIDWRLTLATLAGVPIAFAIYVGNQNLLKKLTRLQKKSLIEANSRMIEYIQGIPVLKAFNQTGVRFEKLEKALDSYKEANLNLVTQLATPTVAFSGFLELGFVVILIVGTYILFGGELTVSTFLLFLILGLRFYEPLSELFELSGMTRMMDVALERVIATLKEQPLTEPTEEQHLKSFDIEFRNVSFSYEKVPVLQSLNFQVPQKSVTALVGPSGSGKTTITNLIARFWDVDSGEILIGGVNIKNIKNDALLSKISIVFQNVYLFNDTILNNIKFGNPNATLEEVITSAKAAQCHDFIEKLPKGYDTVIGDGGASLSGGEKQRISIARAILKDAPIVLLDEATASVDPENELLLQKAINLLVESKTLIIIAHRLSTITSSDQILVINDGKIAEQGKHEELIKNGNGLYSKLWNYQQRARSWKLSMGELSKLS